MGFRNENMAEAAAYGEQLPEGCYHFRVAKVEDQGDTVLIHSRVQTEPFVGRSVRDQVMFAHLPAIAKLKAYYNAVGYNPGPEGHDPEKILDGEFYAVIKHNVVKGTTYANVEPWSITSMEQGPIQPLGAKVV